MEKFSYFKIGIFVISAVVIGIIGVVVLGVGTIFQKKNIVETYIDESVQGLDVGSPVKFRGVPVGRVEQISLTSAEYATRREYVLVRVSISSNILQFPVNDPRSPQLKQALDRGFRIRIAPQGLTGVAYLEADYLEPERNPPLEIDWQPEYPYIPSTRSRITQLSEAVERILRNFSDIDIAQLSQTIDKSIVAMTKLAENANLDKIGAQANALLSELRADQPANKHPREQSGAQNRRRRRLGKRGAGAPNHRARGKADQSNADRSAPGDRELESLS